MRRKLQDTLLTWKKEPQKRPLLLTGTRQVGKTWLLRDFGRRYYSNTAYYHLETDTRLRSFVEQEQEAAYFLEFLEIHSGVPIRARDTLVILDEIQACPAVRKVFRTFAQEFPGYSIAAVERIPFPGGLSAITQADAQIETLRPMDFEEFLWACREVALAKEIREHFNSQMPMDKSAHQQALRLFSTFLVVGGFPGAVQKYREEHSLLELPDIHSKLLRLDFSDLMENLPREERAGIHACYQSIPRQLEKENAIFQYRTAQKGSTRKQMEQGIQWLADSGLALLVRETGSDRHFKLYLRDHGICATGMGVPIASFLGLERTLPVQRVMENYLATAFRANGYSLSCWSSGNRAALPFLLEKEKKRIAIDLHTDEKKKSRSLFEYRKKFPEDTAYRISGQNFKKEDGYMQLPYYAAFCI